MLFIEQKLTKTRFLPEFSHSYIRRVFPEYNTYDTQGSQMVW